MWKHLFAGGIFKLEQQNAASKRLILSVLNSTATKREAKDYLTKYKSDSNAINHCFLLIRRPNAMKTKHISQLAETIKRLRMLGLRPMFVIPPSHNIYKQAEILDIVITVAGLRPLHLNNALSKSVSGKYTSILESQRFLFNDPKFDVIPIIKPYIYKEKNATENLAPDEILYLEHLSQGNIPHIDKFFIINNIGGIPSDERKKNAHVFVNLSQEYIGLTSNLSNKVRSLAKKENNSASIIGNLNRESDELMINSLHDKYKEHLLDLQLMNTVLSNLSSTSTGLITTIDAALLSSDKKNPLVYNLLTDRSLISSSLPRFKQQTKKIHSFDSKERYELYSEFREKSVEYETKYNINPTLVTTVLKKGVDIKNFDFPILNEYNSIGLPPGLVCKNITEYTGTSEKVDLVKIKSILDQSFGKSLDLCHYLNRINGSIASIIVIGDYEGIAILTHEGPQSNTFVYLDKFAVTPKLKGCLGISDIIFNLMFKKFPKELLWRSRRDNIVNKWYFQRSVGVLDLSMDLGIGNKKESQFKLFYSGDSETSQKSFRDIKRLQEYSTHVRDIQPSWEK